MKFFMVICLCIFVQSFAMASDRLNDIRSAHPSLSKFEVLKQLYNDSQRPAQLSDFHFQNEATSQLCLAILESDPNKLFTFNVVRVKTDDNGGPLFPSDGEKLLYFGGNNRNINVSAFIGSVDFPQSTATDLVSHVNQSTSFYDSPSTMNARKNGNYISLLVTDFEGGSNFRSGYGYCYSKQ